MKRVIVTGGSGFIGSSVVDKLLNLGMYHVVIVDKTINPWTKNLISLRDNVTIIEDDIRNLTTNVLGCDVYGVIHLAADHVVPQSVWDPLKFYTNNMNGMIHLLNVLSIDQPGRKPLFVYSSSAAVYQSQLHPISEELPKSPTNAYGQTKLWGEEILNACSVYGLNHVSLRYFNVAGAGIHHGYIAEPATHVIPILIRNIKHDECFIINGNNYNTPDGTCVRDYIHVKDVALAHVQALFGLEKHGNMFPKSINLGYGEGTSIRSLIDTTEKTLDVSVKYNIGQKRDGDPAMLVADVSKAKKWLDWMPMYGLSDMIKDAWDWENARS